MDRSQVVALVFGRTLTSSPFFAVLMAVAMPLAAQKQKPSSAQAQHAHDTAAASYPQGSLALPADASEIGASGIQKHTYKTSRFVLGPSGALFFDPRHGDDFLAEAARGTLWMRGPSWKQGVLDGAVFGATIFGTVGVLAWSTGWQRGWLDRPSDPALFAGSLALAGGLAGAIVGAGIGSLFSVWRQVPQGRRLHLHLDNGEVRQGEFDGVDARSLYFRSASESESGALPTAISDVKNLHEHETDWCFRAGVDPECINFLIVEAGAGKQIDELDLLGSTQPMLHIDLGIFHRLNSRFAIGGLLGVDWVRDAGYRTDLRLGGRVRYRPWLGAAWYLEQLALDLSAAAIVGGTRARLYHFGGLDRTEQRLSYPGIDAKVAVNIAEVFSVGAGLQAFRVHLVTNDSETLLTPYWTIESQAWSTVVGAGGASVAALAWVSYLGAIVLTGGRSS